MEIIHHHFETLLSTNSYAKENLSSFPKDKLIIISTRHQTNGYGQQGRTWVSPPGNIAVSICLFTQNDIEPFLITRLMCEILQKFFKRWNIDATIKWPNDLLVNGKKIMGILTETFPLTDVTAIIIGMGINVNLSKEVAETIDQPVTSLFLETGQKFDEQEILNELIKACYEVLKKFIFGKIIP